MYPAPALFYFNSHPHEEDDGHAFGLPCMGNISTHILTRRMTMMNGYVPDKYMHFNSHPHEEDDYTLFLLISNTSYFNSHPHEEDD